MGLRFFDWTSVPIIIAVFIAANDYLLKPNNYDTIFNGFAILFTCCFLIPLIPVDTLIFSNYFRMFIAIEINLAALFGFIKTRSASFLLFIFSMMSLSIGGMSLLSGDDAIGIYGNVVGQIFLGLIFFIPQKENHGISAYFSIEEKLKDTKKALTESEYRYSRIFNAAKDGFLIFDLKGNIVDANQKAFEMYQYPREEFLTLSGNEIVHPDYSHLFKQFKESVQKCGEFQTESVDVKKDGSPFDVEIRGADIEYGGQQHLLAIVRDISERKRAEEELQKLSRFANDYVNIPSDQNIFADLCQKIKSLIGPGIVLVNRIENEKTMILESIEGIDKRRLDWVNKLIGPVKAGKTISHMDNQAKGLLTKGMLVEVPNGLSGLSFGKIPPTIGKTIEKMMHIKKFYSIGLRHEDNLFGNVVIVSTDATSINKNTIEVISNQAAVVLDKKRAWEELQNAHEKIQTMNQMLEKKVQERTEKIEQLLKQKDDFINQLGHDLKNPLGPLINLLPIVEKHTINAKDKEILQVVQRNVGYMKNLVQKTLELARLNSPNTKLSKSTFSLNDLIDQIISQNIFLFEENNITITSDLDENITINADKLKIEELFNNLLNNAVKYSKESGEIHISAIQKLESITISIKDTGIGMSKDQIDHLFDEFYKADESRHDFDSSGLGMAICRRIIEKHGGTIWAESKGIGFGTSIHFTLPLSSRESTDGKTNDIKDDGVHQKIDSILQEIY